MTKENEIMVQEEKAVNTFITDAIAKGLPVETMTKLFELRKEVKAEYAREEFMKAMAKFQSECPVIEKTKKVMGKDGTSVRYSYADLGSIVEQVKKPLADNLLSYDFDTVEKDSMLEVVCVITHALGHSKSSTFKVPIGTEQYMTDVQKYGARGTFAKRYAFCNALGILTGDEDTDANEEKKPEQPVAIKARIVMQLKELGEAINSKEKVSEAIIRLTKLSPVGDDKQMQEISSRLAVLISEKKEAK